MLFFQASGSPVGPLGHPAWKYFVAPLGAESQLTVLGGEVSCPLEGQTFAIVPLPGIATQVEWSDAANEFLYALSTCFPTTQVIRRPLLGRNDDDSGGDDDEHTAPLGSTAAPVMHRSSLSFRVVRNHELHEVVPAPLAATLLGLYPGPFSFAVSAIPPTPLATPLRCAFAAVHNPTPQGLWVPTASGASGALNTVRWDASVYSVGTVRRPDWSGGGKTPAEALEDIRHRHASGTFTATVSPSHEWCTMRNDPSFSPPELVALFSAVDEARDIVPAGPCAGAPTLPRSAFPCGPPLNVVRMKKVLLGPDVDLVLALDYGTQPRDEE